MVSFKYLFWLAVVVGNAEMDISNVKTLVHCEAGEPRSQ